MIIREIQLVDIKNNMDKIKKLILDVLDINLVYNSSKEIDRIYENMIIYKEDGTALIFGAFEDEELLGFIWGYERISNNINTIHVNHLVVDSKSRSKGLGGKLLNTLEQVSKLKNIDKIELMATCSNKKTIDFYEKNNFNKERVLLCKKI